MKTIYSVLLILSLCASVFSFPGSKNCHPRQLILKNRGNLSKHNLQKKFHQIESVKFLFSNRKGNSFYAIDISGQFGIEETFRQFQKDGYEVYYNHILKKHSLPNDPSYYRQWYLKTIGAEQAWGRFEGTGEVPVYILDSGIDYTHPDLDSSIYLNPNEIPDNNIDDDGNGFIDDYRGWDFVTVNSAYTNSGDGFPMDNDPRDCSAHGTAVAGLIGAISDNNEGIASLNRNPKICPLRIAYAYQYDEYALESDVAAAVYYCITQKARIINFSYGSQSKTPLLYESIREAADNNIIFVASAGNTSFERKEYPAAYPEATAVGAITENGFSRYTFGLWIDYVAPGNSIYTTVPSWDLSYTTANGTSVAAPLVSAAIAYLMEYAPSFTNDQILYALSSGCAPTDGKNPEYQYKMGHGLINLEQSLDVIDSAYSLIIDHAALTKLNESEIPESLFPRDTAELSFQIRNPGKPVSQLSGSYKLITHNREILASGSINASLADSGSQNYIQIKEQLIVPDSINHETELLLIFEHQINDSEPVEILKTIPQTINPIFHTVRTEGLFFSVGQNGLIGHQDNSDDYSSNYTQYYLGEGCGHKDIGDLIYSGSVWFKNANKLYSGNNPGELLAQWENFNNFSAGRIRDSILYLSYKFGLKQDSLNLEIIQNTYYTTANYFILEYAIPPFNQSFQSPRLGLFSDFDIVQSDYNQIETDSNSQIIFQNYSGNKYSQNIYIGMAAINNNHNLFAQSGFWGLSMDSAFKIQLLDTTFIDSSEGDIAFLISQGKDSVHFFEDSLKFIYFLSIDSSKQNIRENYRSAIQLYNLIRDPNQYQDKHEPQSSAENFQIFPNPANGLIRLSIFSAKPDICDIKIFNILGQQKLTKRFIHSGQDQVLNLNLQKLPSGIYFIKIEFQNQTQQFIKKLMIIH